MPMRASLTRETSTRLPFRMLLPIRDLILPPRKIRLRAARTARSTFPAKIATRPQAGNPFVPFLSSITTRRSIHFVACTKKYNVSSATPSLFSRMLVRTARTATRIFTAVSSVPIAPSAIPSRAGISPRRPSRTTRIASRYSVLTLPWNVTLATSRLPLECSSVYPHNAIHAT